MQLPNLSGWWLRLIALTLLAGGLILELGYQTYWLNARAMYISPVLWLLGGLLSCAAAFHLAGFKRSIPLISNRLWIRGMLMFVCFALGAWYIGSWLSEIFAAFPIDPKSSDIVPSLQLYVRRWLSGEQVYAPLEFGRWVVDPTYMPLLWMPYAFSELLQIDYRWTAYAVFLLGLACWQWRLIRQDIPLWEVIFKALLPFVFLHVFLTHNEKMFGLAVELLPVGFYLILAITILHRKPWLMALGILLCLLSRYAFTFWLPVYLLIICLERGLKTGVGVSMAVAVGVLLLYVIPFLSKDWSILSKGLAYYQKTAETQWVRQSWQEEGKPPYHLSRGLGFAIYFHSYHRYTLMDRLAFNRKAHLLISAMAALLLLVGYFLFRKRGLNVRLYLLIGLKCYLLLFYGFFYVPFSYLFLLPFFMTLPLLYSVPLAKRLTWV